MKVIPRMLVLSERNPNRSVVMREIQPPIEDKAFASSSTSVAQVLSCLVQERQSQTGQTYYQSRNFE